MAILSSLGHVLRLARAAFVFAREGAFVGVDPVTLPPVLRLPLALANLIAKRDGDGLAGLSRAIDRLFCLFTQIPASDGGVLAAEQFYAHVPVDGLPGRTPHFYRWRTDDGFTSDVRSAATAMPSARDAVGPFRFTMLGDQGTDQTPLLPVPWSKCRGP